MPKYTVYENLNAFYPARLRLLFHELKVPYTSVQVDLFNGSSLTPEFLKLSPEGTVPVLVRDEFPPMSSSLEICKLVNASHAPLGEINDSQEKLIKEVAAWNGNTFMLAASPQLDGLFIKLNAYKINFCKARMAENPNLAAIYQAKIDSLSNLPSQNERSENVSQVKAIVDTAEKQLSTFPFLAGDSYTLADLLFTVVLYRIGVAGKLSMIDTKPQVKAYYARMQERPSFSKTFNDTFGQRLPIFGLLPAMLRAFFCDLTGLCRYSL